MTRAPADSAAPQSPSRAAERGAASPPPSPAIFTPFGRRFIQANAEWPGVLAAMNRPPSERGMPVAPRVGSDASEQHMTPVQRLAKGKPGIPGHDSYTPRPDDAPLSPYTHLGIPRRDRIWMVQFLALAGAAWFLAERLGWLS
jgi:hypothetical protein